MARSWSNPLAFRPRPVTIISSLVYGALFVALLIVHFHVPSAPSNSTPYTGINITEAWLDLKFLTNGPHPYNSRRNDVIRNWLLQRLDDILDSNNATYTTDSKSDQAAETAAIIFNDMQSNLTFTNGNLTVYFEGTNIIVYIRGSEDGPDDWKTGKRSGVLVNAHYDSVSTGHGATDDGVGVVTVLQLIKHFTYPGNQPRRGLVALLNNGEEDSLNGARAFARHPISSFPHTFLNLEGAGAGGKAALFRSTDTEVTRFYKGTKSPFATVISGDAFNRGAIKSQTDYIVFNGDLGMRGLDVAFVEPRARYHTDQDDTRHTSKDSLWHMLSASVHTLQGLTSDSSDIFDGKPEGRAKLPTGTGSTAVWFDLFGKVFIIFELHTLFAISVTLLVVAPIFLFITIIILAKTDKFYMFSLSKKTSNTTEDLHVYTGGLRGFFRFPIIFLLASAGVIGLAFLITKLNPFIVYSSPYAVWSMMISAWTFLAWFFSRSIDAVRPSAFHRGYVLIWLFALFWVLLVVETVYEERLGIAGGYPVVIYFAVVAFATLINLYEQFGLETKTSYAERHSQTNFEDASYSEPRVSEDQEIVPDEDATESTSLLRGPKRTTFANYSSSNRNREADTESESVQDDPSSYPGVFKHEQLWSENLPSWLWILQLLLLLPVPIIILGQIGLFLTSAMPQTLADGNAPLPVYLALAIFTILIMLPLGPFLHRYTYHIPTFLLLVLIGTTVYNTIAFPFSGNNRLKVYFVQKVDLDSGINTVSLMSPNKKYLDMIVETLPSAAGQKVTYSESIERVDTIQAQWTGLSPMVVPNTQSGLPPASGFVKWLSFNATRNANQTSATIALYGRRTRSCRIRFHSPVNRVRVEGSDYEPRIPSVSEHGSTEIRLWRREWERPWNVTFDWKDQPGMDGTVVCQWNDEDGQHLIPAIDEIRRFAPDWVAVTKASDGLVEGSKAFTV